LKQLLNNVSSVLVLLNTLEVLNNFDSVYYFWYTKGLQV